jgi:hypothetical protein
MRGSFFALQAVGTPDLVGNHLFGWPADGNHDAWNAATIHARRVCRGAGPIGVVGPIQWSDRRFRCSPLQQTHAKLPFPLGSPARKRRRSHTNHLQLPSQTVGFIFNHLTFDELDGLLSSYAMGLRGPCHELPNVWYRPHPTNLPSFRARAYD